MSLSKRAWTSFREHRRDANSPFALDDRVQVVTGQHEGAAGQVVHLERIEPDLVYVVELDGGVVLCDVRGCDLALGEQPPGYVDRESGAERSARLWSRILNDGLDTFFIHTTNAGHPSSVHDRLGALAVPRFWRCLVRHLARVDGEPVYRLTASAFATPAHMGPAHWTMELESVAVGMTTRRAVLAQHIPEP